MVFYPREYRDIPTTDLLSWLFSSRTINPRKKILIDASDETNSIDWHEAQTMIRKLVAGFRAIGLKSGDAVCLHSFNHILYAIFYLGIIGAGGCAVGSNPSYNTIELAHLFLKTTSKYFIIESSLLDKTLPALLASKVPSSNIFIFALDDTINPIGFKSWKTLLQYGERDWICFDNETTAKSTPAALLLTSGTTGLPKAAVISHHAYVAAGVVTAHSEDKPYEVSRLISLPAHHAFTAPLVLISPFYFGHKTYIMRRFEVKKFVRYLHRYSITETAIVPPIAAALINGHTDPSALKNLKLLWCAGSSLSRSLNDGLNYLLCDDAVIAQVWGMTELGWVSAFAWPEKDTTGSVGKLLPNMEAKLVGDQGEEITRERYPGEICIRGPSTMSGYLKESKATNDTLDHDWLKTGDVGYIENGKVYIIDRIKDLIKVRGWQVSPTELESTLLLHPCIIDAAVIGIRDVGGQGGSEVPRAYVVTQHEPSVLLTGDNLKDFVKKRLASYKALEGGVVFVNSIPRNASGKILRKLLVD